MLQQIHECDLPDGEYEFGVSFKNGRRYSLRNKIIYCDDRRSDFNYNIGGEWEDSIGGRWLHDQLMLLIESAPDKADAMQDFLVKCLTMDAPGLRKEVACLS